MSKYIRVREEDFREIKNILISHEMSFEVVEFADGEEKVVDKRDEEDYYQSSEWEDSSC